MGSTGDPWKGNGTGSCHGEDDVPLSADLLGSHIAVRRPRTRWRASWSNGKSRELKNYGLACEAHRDSQLALAQLHRLGLKLAEGETVGTVGLHELAMGSRDADLARLPDHG